MSKKTEDATKCEALSDSFEIGGISSDKSAAGDWTASVIEEQRPNVPVESPATPETSKPCDLVSLIGPAGACLSLLPWQLLSERAAFLAANPLGAGVDGGRQVVPSKFGLAILGADAVGVAGLTS